MKQFLPVTLMVFILSRVIAGAGFAHVLPRYPPVSQTVLPTNTSLTPSESHSFIPVERLISVT